MKRILLMLISFFVLELASAMQFHPINSATNGENFSGVAYSDAALRGLDSWSVPKTFSARVNDEKDGQEVSHLYTFNLKDITEWTVIDADKDKVTWGIISGYDGITCKMSAKTGDDWLITKAFEVKAGRAYKLTYTLNVTAGGFDKEIVDVRFGSVPSVDGMTTEINKEEFDGSVRTVIKFVPTVSGSCYIGFHKCSPAAGGSVSLTEAFVDQYEVVAPNAVSELKGVSKTVEGKVELSWVNPTQDVAGMELSGQLNVKVYRGDLLIKTLKGNVGASMTCEDFPTPFRGTLLYKVIPCIGDVPAQDVKTIPVNLDEIQGGDTIPVYYTDFKDEAERDLWTVIHITDNPYNQYKWAYDKSYNGMRLPWQGDGVKNDWLISPVVKLEKGKRYVLKFTVWTHNNGSDFRIMIGKDKTPEAQNQQIYSVKGLSTNGTIVVTTDQFIVNETADYYIGIHGTKSPNGITIQNIKASYIDLPKPAYLHVFDVNNLAEWTVADANNDQNTWKKADNVEGITYQPSAQAANDWLITKGIVLEKGKAYEMFYSLGANGESEVKDKMEVYFGSAANAAGMKTLLKAEEFGEGIQNVVRFSPEESGTYYLGFLLNSPANAKAVSLNEAYVNVFVASAPEAVSTLKAAGDKETEKVVLTWLNPTLNLDGGEIRDNMSFQIYRNDNLIKTLTGARGVGMAYEDTPSPFTGIATYKVIPYWLGKAGEAKTLVINLDDITGPEENLCTFNVHSLTDWTIEDANTDSKTWKKVDGITGITYEPASQAANDWLITKGFDVTQGKIYTLTYSFNVADAKAVKDKVEIYFGTSATSSALTANRIKTLEFSQGLRDSVRFTAGSTGKIYIGFRECSPAQGGKVSLTEAYVNEHIVIAPEEVLNLKVTSDKAASKVLLSWTNPMTDVKGNKIVDELVIKLYRDNELLKTLTGTPDAKMTQEDVLASFAGSHVYKVVASIFEVSSDPVSRTINLDHMYSFDLKDRSEWTIIDVNKDNATWKFTEPGITYNAGSAATADDWLITKGISMQAGKPYSFAYSMDIADATDATSEHNVEIYIGKTPNASMTDLAKSETFKQNLNSSTRLIAAETGTYYIGIRLKSPKAAGSVTLKEAYVNRLPDITALAVTGLEGKFNQETMKVNLTWTNPSKDTDNVPLAENDLSMKVYTDGVFATTIQTKPGQTESYEVDATSLVGKTVQFKVASYVLDFKGGESQVSVDVILNSIESLKTEGIRYVSSTSELLISREYTSVEIIDLSGRIVMADHSGNTSIDLSALPDGTYVAKVNAADSLVTLKLMKE